MKNKILSFLLVALATTSYAQEVAPVEQQQKEEIPVEQVASSDDASLDTLDDYAVTAYRFPTSQLDTPVNTTVITANDIAESFSTNIADVLQKKANVQFNNGWSGGTAMSSISMRGFGENSDKSVLIIIDGQKMNRADMAPINWQQIPLEYIESIEVMRGSQTAMYGNNAMGGVIKITTKRGSAEDTYSANFSGGSYGSYNVNGLVTGSAGDWAWSADVGRMSTDGYRDNGYEWTNSYNLSATNKLSEALSLSVSASFSQSEFGLVGGLSWDEYLSDPTASSYYDDSYYGTEEGVYTIALNSKTDFGEGEIAFSASIRNIDSAFGMMTYLEDNAYYYYRSDFYSKTNNDQLSLNFTPKYKFNISDDAHVIVGLDMEYIEIDADTSFSYVDDYVNYLNPLWSSVYYSSLRDIGNIQRYSIAPYIAGDLTVADKFVFTAAARFDYTVTKGDCIGTYKDYDEDMNSKGLAANLGVVYKIDNNSSVYFRFDQVYNNPTVDEIAYYQGYAAYVDAFNSDLKAEHGQNFEIGYKYMDKNWTLNANAFVLYLQDEIYYNDIGGYYNSFNDNYDDPTLRYGFEYQISYDDKYWGASLMGTIMKAEFLGGVYDNCDVPLVPNFTNMLVLYVKPIETFRLSMTLSYTSSSNLSGDYYGEYNKASDYFLLGFVAEFKVTEYATLYFGIENALDEDYITWGSAYGSSSSDYSIYAGTGRVFKAGLNLTF